MGPHNLEYPHMNPVVSPGLTFLVAAVIFTRYFTQYNFCLLTQIILFSVNNEISRHLRYPWQRYCSRCGTICGALFVVYPASSSLLRQPYLLAP